MYCVGWAVACVSATAAAYVGAEVLFHEVTDYSRVRLGTPGSALEGDALIDAASARALLEQRQQELSQRALPVRVGASELGTVTPAEMGARVDIDETLARLERAARRERVRVPWLGEHLAKDEPTLTVPPVIHVDADRLTLAASELKEEVDLPAVDARIDLDAHQVVPEQVGRTLDIALLAERVESVTLSAFVTGAPVPFEVPTLETLPKLTKDSAEAIDIHEVVAEFETHFSRAGEQSRRGENIDRAAAKLDGLVLQPNQPISFNAVVGERSEANGFKRSWEIFKGEMVEGIGGGTCQVASTLHAASFFGGIDIVERVPHSRPSAYITMGLDSTVVYPNVDLKLKNPFPFPVVVHTKTTASSLKVELLGKARPVSVKFSREVQKRIPFTRKIVEEPSLAANRVVHKQHGIDGYRIKRFREMVFSDGTKKVEETTDYYPPTFDIFEVPVGFDERRLPGGAGDSEAVAMVSTSNGSSADGALAGSVARSADGAGAGDELIIVDGKGAHRPSRGQQRPEASLRMTR